MAVKPFPGLVVDSPPSSLIMRPSGYPSHRARCREITALHGQHAA
jgi:hypothetical protein